MPLQLHLVGFSTVPRPGTMGGNTRIFLEWARQLQGQPNIQLRLYVSEAARQTCLVSGLGDQISYHTTPTAIDAEFYSPLSHLRVSQAGWRVIREAAASAGGGPHVIYSGSDFWPDVVTGWQLARQLRGLWIASIFLFAPHPAYGYLGEFARQFHRPDGLATLLWLYQRTTQPLIRRAARMIVVTNDYDRPRLRGAQAYPDGVHAIYGGVDLAEARASPPDPAVDYAACFVGRLHPMKGIAQLLDAWAYVVRQQPQARLALIGVGRQGYVEAMRQRGSELGLDRAVDWLGYRDGPAKYAIIKRSRVFLHTSIYDNNGMAACEAMAAGVPAVLFDLPPLRFAYPNGVLRAPLGDTQAFAECVLTLLADEGLRTRLSQEGLALAAQWSWEARVAELMRKIEAALAAGKAV